MAALVGVVLFNVLIDLVWLVLAVPVASSAFKCGMLVAYIAYDLTHYYLHHGTPSLAYFRRLRAVHMHHHYKNHATGVCVRAPSFTAAPLNTPRPAPGRGISSSLWDHLFGTMPPEAELAVYLK